MDTYFEDYWYKTEDGETSEDQKVRELKLALEDRDFQKAKLSLQALVTS